MNFLFPRHAAEHHHHRQFCKFSFWVTLSPTYRLSILPTNFEAEPPVVLSPQILQRGISNLHCLLTVLGSTQDVVPKRWYKHSGLCWWLVFGYPEVIREPFHALSSRSRKPASGRSEPKEHSGKSACPTRGLRNNFRGQHRVWSLFNSSTPDESHAKPLAGIIDGLSVTRSERAKVARGAATI